MNLRDLRYFVAVADKLHFGKAALACHVSQPTLSMQIKKLEEFLGLTLIERSNKQVRLTPAGTELAQRARSILRAADGMVEYAALQRDPMAGDLRLGAFPTLAPYYLPSAVPRISRAMPKLRLLLVEEKTDVLLAKLHAGEIDAALLALPLDMHGLEARELFSEPFLLAVPKQHALAKQKHVELNELAAHHLLLLEDGHCMRAQALEVCSLAGAKEEEEFRATSLETLRQMVASGGGITLIPKLAASPTPGLAYLNFTTPPKRVIGLIWRKTSARRELLLKISELLKA